MSKVDLLINVLERYGFAVVACCGIAWFANSAVEYERGVLMPALDSNTKAIERNTEVMRQVPAVIKKYTERQDASDP